MTVPVTAQNFDDILARQDGFLVNVWTNNRTAIHDLRHAGRTCRAMMQAESPHPKLFASTLDEALAEARRHSEPLHLCKLCLHQERPISQ